MGSFSFLFWATKHLFMCITRSFLLMRCQLFIERVWFVLALWLVFVNIYSWDASFFLLLLYSSFAQMAYLFVALKISWRHQNFSIQTCISKDNQNSGNSTIWLTRCQVKNRQQHEWEGEVNMCHAFMYMTCGVRLCLAAAQLCAVSWNHVLEEVVDTITKTNFKMLFLLVF